jgi:cysteine desulfurase family protein
MLYLDNAATSFPKAPGVPEAVARFLNHVGVSAGRAGHGLARQADALLWETRTLVARLLGVGDPGRVVFSLNVTHALNTALLGLLRQGDHVVTSAVEHNSVMRPLRHLEAARGVGVSVVPCSPQGLLDPGELVARLTPQTRLIVLTHASNVTGSLLPVEEVAAAKGRALLLVDAAQTAGCIPIGMEAAGIDLLAFTGHKAMLGPPGVGGLCIGPHIEVPPLVRGGTGTASDRDEHPAGLPLALEAGTHNMAGLAGLREAVSFLLTQGVQAVMEAEGRLMDALLAGLEEIPGVHLYGPPRGTHRAPVLSLNVAGVHPSHVAAALEQAYGILVRDGLHCAPAAHRTMGTFPDGAVRISPGPFQTVRDMERTVEAVRSIARQLGR